jgi:hypothetical protein
MSIAALRAGREPSGAEIVDALGLDTPSRKRAMTTTREQIERLRWEGYLPPKEDAWHKPEPRSLEDAIRELNESRDRLSTEAQRIRDELRELDAAINDLDGLR